MQRINLNNRTSRINSISRLPHIRSGSKFSMLKKILNRKKGGSATSKPKKKKNPYLLLFKRIAIATSFVFLLAALAGSIVVAVWVSNISKDLPNPDNPFATVSQIGDSYVYAKQGDNFVQLRSFTGSESRDFVKIEDVPDYVKTAFVAAENKTFYEDKGVDLWAIFRSALGALQKQEIVGGGSTITQQVVKNTIEDLNQRSGSSRNLSIKLKEAILAIQIAQKYDKDQVLQLYINSIPFGSTFVGLKTAARAYFNKDVKDLTYAEAALLAGIPNEPSRLAPCEEGGVCYAVSRTDIYDTVNGKQVLANVNRQHGILDRMMEIADKLNQSQHFSIDKDKIKAAYDEPIHYNFAKTEYKAPHFTRNEGVVYNELKDKLKQMDKYKDYTDVQLDGVITSGGLRVYTTLDYEMQQKAEEEVSKIDNNTEKISGNLTSWDLFGAKNSSLISVSPKTGAVYAYVGSAGFDRNEGGKINGQVDMIQTPVPQGSSMKVANYMDLFIQKGAGPDSVLANFYPLYLDKNYAPKNFSVDRTQAIASTIRNNLNNSLNIPATQALMAGGVDNYANLVGKMGYNESEVQAVKDAGITATLGTARISPWSHAQLFQVMANSGVRQDLYTIDKISDRDGNVLYEHKTTSGTRVVDERYVYLMYDILKGYTTLTYPDGVRKYGYDCAGKTGTYSQDDNISGSSNHIVFWGFCPNLVTGMWAGNNDNSPLKTNAVGEKLGQTHWTTYMKAVLPKFPKDKFPPRPAGIVEKSICKDTGFLATADNPCEKVTGLFVEDNLPKTDDNHKKLTVTNCNGIVKLAGKADILSGNAHDEVFTRYESLTGNDFVQKQIDEYATKQGHPPPPTETCNDPHTTDGTIYTKVTSPADGTQYNAGDLITDITADTVADNANMKFYFDDTFITEVNSSPYKASFNIPGGATPGPHVIKAVATDKSGKTGTGTINIIVKSNSGNLDEVNVQITSPTDNAIVAHGNLTINGTVSDPYSRLNSIKFYGKKVSDGSITLIGNGNKDSGNNYHVNWTVNTLGQYEVYIVVSDGSLNKESGHIRFTVV